MTKGSGDARTQPLYFLITTAGNDTNTICYEVHQKAQDILDGRKADPTFYPVIYGADTTDDWTDPEVWKKANPSLGITVGIDKVEAACESAKQNPGEENSFQAASAQPMGEAGRPLDADGEMGRLRVPGERRRPRRPRVLRRTRPVLHHRHHVLRAGVPAEGRGRQVRDPTVLLGAGGHAGAARQARPRALRRLGEGRTPRDHGGQRHPLRLHREVHRAARREVQHPRDRLRPLGSHPDGAELGEHGLHRGALRAGLQGHEPAHEGAHGS